MIKIFQTLKKYVLFDRLILFCGLLILWFIEGDSYNLLWTIFGLVGGGLIEAFRFIAQRKNRKEKYSFLSFTLWLSVFFIFLHIIEPKFLSITVGVLIPSTVSIILEQILVRKMLTWDDIDKERESTENL